MGEGEPVNDECEVCLGPDANATLTLQVPEVDPCPIAVCKACMALLVGAMVVRYNAAVVERDREVDRWLRLLGIEVPT